MDGAIREALNRLLLGENLSRLEAREAMSSVLEGRLDSSLIASFLTALKVKGESAEEIVGFVQALRETQVVIDPGVAPIVDTCGTGGDGRKTFNISTTAAFAAAACGIYVAKHGNRGISSPCGSADVLAALGAGLSWEPWEVEECIRETGIGFLFAPDFTPAMKNVMPVRKVLGFPTVFNVLGPLANPARVTRQVVGVNSRTLVPLIGEALAELGVEKAFVIHGSDGMDEFTLCGETYVCEIDRGETRSYLIGPEDVGLERCAEEELRSNSAEESAKAFMEVVKGISGPKLDAVAANAGFALVVSGKASNLRDGVGIARDALRSGEAYKRFELFLKFSEKRDGRC